MVIARGWKLGLLPSLFRVLDIKYVELPDLSSLHWGRVKPSSLALLRQSYFLNYEEKECRQGGLGNNLLEKNEDGMVGHEFNPMHHPTCLRTIPAAVLCGILVSWGPWSLAHDHLVYESLHIQWQSRVKALHPWKKPLINAKTMPREGEE